MGTSQTALRRGRACGHLTECPATAAASGLFIKPLVSSQPGRCSHSRAPRCWNRLDQVARSGEGQCPCDLVTVKRARAADAGEAEAQGVPGQPQPAVRGVT